MVLLTIVFYIAAAILFALAFANVGSKYNLMAGGLFLWVCTELIGRIAIS